MISISEAKSKLQEHVVHTEVITTPLAQSLNHVIAEDVIAPMAMPPFDQSAMDGYALGEGNLNIGSSYQVVGEVAAGNSMQWTLKDGQCVRIFTGAAVPASAQTVVQQEWIKRTGDFIVLQKEVKSAANIRKTGEQIKAGEIALHRGTLINAACIGFLAMLGISEVRVYSSAKVKIIVTGDELISPSAALGQGQIFESNGIMLQSALASAGIKAEKVQVRDEFILTLEALKRALKEMDVVVITGGISVGDHDHVYEALQSLGVETVFYKVNQKPGKPFFFGKLGQKAVFALPGNPQASLTCFYVYVLPYLCMMQHHPNPDLEKRFLPLADDYQRSGDRAVLLNAVANSQEVRIQQGQSSGMLNTYASANAIVHFDEDTRSAKKGQQVEVWMIPD